MNAIMTTHNLRAWYTNAETDTGWVALIYERLPILALRNRASWDAWPCSWQTHKANFGVAIDAALLILKSWQAFRPSSLKSLRPKLESEIRTTVGRFQQTANKLGADSLRAALKLDAAKRSRLVDAATTAVARLSACKPTKSTPSPMMGSKILHLFLPEYFPVWDDQWVRRKGLRPYGLHQSNDYRGYLELLLKDDGCTPKNYAQLKREYLRHQATQGVPAEVVEWLSGDLTPAIFELCLIAQNA